MAAETHVTISVSPELARQLPAGADDLAEVIGLGLKSWRIERALSEYQSGHGTLAFAAEQAGVALREMIALAYAHGLQPKLEPQLAGPLSLEDACCL